MMSERKFTLVIHMAQHISNGRGIPKFVLNLFKYTPRDRFSLVLVQSDWIEYQRVASSALANVISKCDEVLTYHDRTVKVNFLMKNRFTSFFVYLLLKPLLMRIDRFLMPKEIKMQMNSADILYLTSNYYHPYSRRVKNVVGSCHTFFVTGNLPSRIQGALAKCGLIYKFPVVHCFPGYEKYFERKGTTEFTVPLGVDTTLFFPREQENHNKKRLLFVASLERGKGFDTILSLFDAMDKERFELHVVGKGPMECELNYRESIIYHGALDELRLSEVYSMCDVFVYPTRGDSFGSVVLEALCSGLIVITSDLLSGTFDLYERSGYLEYCEDDADCFMNAIQRACEREMSLTERMVLHELVKSKNDAHKLVIDLYNHFLSRLEATE